MTDSVSWSPLEAEASLWGGQVQPKSSTIVPAGWEDLAVDLVCVTVDCHDPALVASFWNEALRWGGVAVAEDGSGAVCGPRGGGTYLEFVRVPEAKSVKNRMHLGLSAGTLAELDGEIERLLALGAAIAWEEEFPPDVAAAYRNVILRDPEGNEFCLGGGKLPD